MINQDSIASFEKALADSCTVCGGVDHAAGGIACPYNLRPARSPSVLLEAEGIVNGERQGQYGAAEDSFSRIAELWSAYLRAAGVIRADQQLEPQTVADMMITLKLARELHSHKRDNYVDIAGYAELGNRIAEASHG